MTIGQDTTDVVARLRTPSPEANGTPPELRVAGVFEPGRVRQLVITYDGSAMRLFVDGRAASTGLRLAPEPRAFLVGFLTSVPHGHA